MTLGALTLWILYHTFLLCIHNTYCYSRGIIASESQHPALLNSQSQTDSRVVHSFSQLPLRGDVVAALEGIGLSRPTVIQMLAIPKIARGKNVLCAAETGMYKVLYTATILHFTSLSLTNNWIAMPIWLSTTPH